MPILATNKECTGCGSCQNACAHQAILMEPDLEGFLQPKVVTSKCIECGSCVRKCPILNPSQITPKEQKAYAVINFKDRKVSSSGGAFSLFARYVLNKGGVVYGSTMDEGLNVHHTRITAIEDLPKLRGAKYVQSLIGNTFLEAKRDLLNGKLVLFVGTPCQISGLYHYLGKKYEDLLITLDLVCHGVPSQTTFDAYINKIKSSARLNIKENLIEDFRFRQLSSWSIVPAIKIENKKWKLLEQEDNVYMNAFFKLSIFRESCYRCQYSNMNRTGTFTIADYWGVGKEGVPFKKNVSSGVSLVIDNQDIMRVMMDELKQMAYIEERALDEGKMHNHNLNYPSERPAERNTAVVDLIDEDISLLQYAKKYHLLDSKIKYLVMHFFKKVVYSFGLYNVYRSIIYRFGNGS